MALIRTGLRARRAALAAALAAALLAALPVPAAEAAAPRSDFLDLPVQAVFDSNDEYVVFSVDEFFLGTDLDGNGFVGDNVLHTLGPGGAVRNHAAGDGQPRIGELAGRFLLYRAFEGFAGGDLNGDGDASDHVFAVDDLAGGSGYETALATRTDELARLVVGELVVLPVFEQDQGRQDLNGDGDGFDHVLHTVDLASGAVANLGTDASLQVAADTYVVVAIEERGADTDLNGDGDEFDFVAHVLDPATGTLDNLGVGIRGATVAGERVTLHVEEGQQRADLNGDGDRADLILHLFDPAAGLRATGLTVPDFRPDLVHLEDGSIAVGVAEDDQGADLNGDGDTDDRVVHVVDAAGAVTNTGRAGFEFVAGGAEVGFFGSEPRDGVDLNGDGDTDDLVPQVLTPATGELFNSGLAVEPLNRRPEWAFSATIVAVEASEEESNADLNGDGDQVDAIVHLVNRAGGPVVNTGRAITFGTRLLATDEFTALSAAEDRSEADLNGDGDLGDDIGLVVFRDGAEVNLGYEMIAHELRPDGRLMHSADETALLDLNGDGLAWPLLAFTSFANSAPVADAGPDQVVEAVAPAVDVVLDGTGSTDADGDPLTYEWTGGFTAGTATGPEPTVSFAALGGYEVTLTVSDGALTDDDTVTIDVVDTTPPVAEAKLEPVRRPGRRIGRFTVVASCSDSFDPAPAMSASIDGEPVGDGDVVWLMRHKRFKAKRLGNGWLFVRGPAPELTVTCTDGSGNAATAIAAPRFREPRP